jgi:hypothetical protein
MRASGREPPPEDLVLRSAHPWAVRHKASLPRSLLSTGAAAAGTQAAHGVLFRKTRARRSGSVPQRGV